MVAKYVFLNAAIRFDVELKIFIDSRVRGKVIIRNHSAEVGDYLDPLSFKYL